MESKILSGVAAFRKIAACLASGTSCQHWVWVFGLLGLLGARPAQAGSIVREVWDNIPGNSVAELTADARYPAQPTSTELITEFFEAPSEFAENYGQRMHGYIIPPVSGNYTFWIASDDGGELWLSTNESPSTARKIAAVNSWTSSREWGKEPNQESSPIALEASRPYYISALQKEGGGGDNLAVRWLRPDGLDEAPIPGTHLLPWGTSFTPPKISAQPTNTTTVEGQLAQFSVVLDPLSPASVQWRKNDANVQAGTNATLDYGPVRMADAGSRFRAVLTNQLGSTMSAEAILTVDPDVTPPTVLQILNLGTTTLRVTFSEAVEPVSAANKNNYQIGGGVTVTAAEVTANPAIVLLTVSTFTYNSSYVLTLSGIRDQAAAPNVIAANTALNFTANEYAPVDIGGAVNGTTVSVTGGLDVTGGGRSIAGTSDQFHFGYQEKTGDFDFQVRVEGLMITDPYVEAGLMARDTLDATSRFAGIFAGSAQLGAFFKSRATAAAALQAAAPSGGFPVNYPRMYLRLRRSGNTFTGYAGFDGVNWQQLGSQTLTLPAKLFFGLAVASHDTANPATARFRDLRPTQSQASFVHAPTREPLGPSNRRSGIVISEIMYHSLDPDATTSLEFLEIYNAGNIFVELTGWQIDGGVNYRFPDKFQLEAGQFVVVAADPAALAAAYGLIGVLGPFTGRLNNVGDRLTLRNASGAVRFEVNYSDEAPWPASPDGGGHSLILARPSYGEDDPRAWAPSENIGGTPGEVEMIVPNPWKDLAINEFLAHTDDPVLDFIELFNAGTSSLDISGCILTDDISTNKFRVPAGTFLPARGYVSFDQNELGFSLSAAGETIYLVSPDRARVIDAIKFGGQENGVSSGRSGDGTPGIRRLASPTPGQGNTGLRPESIVINEIMYHPISDRDDEQYVELYNRSAVPADLSGWRFTSGIDFRFPAGTSIPSGGYLVIAQDAEHLRTIYPNLTTANCLGNFDGTLKRSGERLALGKRDFVNETNAFGVVITNQIFIAVSEVTFRDGGRWPELADGGGSSLELVDARSDLQHAASWLPSDESNKAQWTAFEFTGRLDQGASGVGIDRFYIAALGAGEWLLDELEVFKVGSTNLLADGNFEQATTAWTFFGNHRGSTFDSAGAAEGAKCLHVRAPGDGDTANNSIRTRLTLALRSGDNVTIRGKARWLAGWPEMLFRIRGNWLEYPLRLTVPASLGTPGLANSRAQSNGGPAIYEVTHTPALPRANQAVLVTCRVSDPDGVAAPRLRFRVDPGSSLTTTPMRDDGTSGDLVAGDGLFTGTISGRSGGTLVAFRVEANDDAAASASSIFPARAPAQECLIRWDDNIPWGTLAHFHMWSTAATESARGASRPLDNTFRDCTIVYNHYRVIYNAGFRDKGSPFHGGSGDYAATVPKDNMLLGTDDRVFGSTGNGGPEGTAMKGSMSAWIASEMGIPYLNGPFIRLYRNGGLFQNVTYDLEQPNRQYAMDWYGGEGAKDELFKIAVWFEFQDDNSGFNSVGATLQKFPSSGPLKLSRYRWNWQIRPSGNTVNDLTSIFNLVNAANSTSERTTRLPLLADMEEWMRVFAFHRVTGNWDSWAFNVGQNMYLYTPVGDRARLLPWDIDFVLGEGESSSGALWGGQDPVVNQLFDLPVYRRMLWRAYQDATNGPMLPERYQPQIDARRSVLTNNAVTGLATPTSIRTYLDARRRYIQGQVQRADIATFAITNNAGADFTTANATVALTGTAPFAVARIEINGVPYPITWTGMTAWRIDVPMGDALNNLQLVAYDAHGRPVPGGTDSVKVTYTGAVPKPEDWIVINEIMHNAPVTGGDFVELHNRHPSFAFDLSGLELRGVGFVFPTGTFLPANGYLCVAEDLGVFAATYGQNITVTGPYEGNLQRGGETLRLIDPATATTPEVLIDDVRYDSTLPWPVATDGLGPSLQLIDPAQDTWRVANWAATAPGDINQTTPGRANSVKNVLDPFPALWINEVLPSNSKGAADRAGEREPWIELYNAGTAAIDLSGFYLSDRPAELTRWQFPVGTILGGGQFLVVWADGEAGEATASELHANFRINPTNGVVLLSRTQLGQPAAIDYVPYVVSSADAAFGSFPDGEPRRRRLLYTPTPGAANNPTVPNLNLFINEWLADNASIIADPADGDYDDWFEIYNAGSTEVDLSGYFLSDSLSQPTQFRIPAGTLVPPGGFRLFWADNEPTQNQPGRDVHTNFRLTTTGEQLGLFTPDGALVDGVTFTNQFVNLSEGRFPDGAAGPYLGFSTPTPGTANVAQFANRPPSIRAIDDRAVNEGQRVALTVLADDSDVPAQTLTFALINPPAGALIDSQTGAFTWTPTEEQGPSVASITVRVTDNGTPPRSVTRTFKISVAEVNQPPAIAPIAAVEIDEGLPFAFHVLGTDPDLPPQPLVYSFEGDAPAGAAISAEGEFTWAPAENQGPANYTIVVRVSDQGTPPAIVTRSFQISVREIDNAPEIHPISAQSIDESTQFRYQVVAADPDSPADLLDFSLATAPTGMTIDAKTGLIAWAPDESFGPRDYTVVVQVSEPGGSPSATLPFVIGVREVNAAPVFPSVADLVVSSGQIVTVPGGATDSDLPAQTLTYRIVSGLPNGANFDQTTGTLSWQISDDPPLGTNRIVMEVRDDQAPPITVERGFNIIVRGSPRVVINEILHRPATPGAEFVELFNYSTANPVDLGGWVLSGYDYLFPPGVVLPPGGFICVARDLAKFTAAYGSEVRVVGNAGLSLPAEGGILRLRKGGVAGEIVDETSFSLAPPWPAPAISQGASLQLVDAREDNRRVGNWAASSGSVTNPPASVVPMRANWRYWQNATAPTGDWKAAAYNDASWPQGGALLYVEGADLPDAKTTALTLGQNVYYFRTQFNFSGSTNGAVMRLSTILDDGAVYYLNGREVFRLGMPEGAVTRETLATRTVGDATLEGPFDFPATGLVEGENVLAVEVHQISTGSSDIVHGAAASLITVSPASFTPGAPNSVARDLPTFGQVWINEVLPNNVAGIVDAAGEHEPWIELYNGGTGAVPLEGWALSDSPGNLAQWLFPAGSSIPAQGYLLVWADGEVAESTAAQFHANFRLNPSAGTVALSSLQNGQRVLIDYLNYSVGAADVAFGLVVDGQPLQTGVLGSPSPGQENGEVAGQPPALGASVTPGGAMRLSWMSETGRVYTVEAVAQLGDAWQTISERAGDGAEQVYEDKNLGATATRFYRLRIAP